MKATLVQQPRCGSRADREAELSALVVEMRSELAVLRREVVSLRQVVGCWRSMHARAVEKSRKLEAEIDLLRAENRKLKDRLFGRRTEKAKRGDRSNHLDDPKIPMDNNASERTVRGPAMGRKNYYGSASEWSGRLAAITRAASRSFRPLRLEKRYTKACG